MSAVASRKTAFGGPGSPVWVASIGIGSLAGACRGGRSGRYCGRRRPDAYCALNTGQSGRWRPNIEEPRWRPEAVVEL